MIFPLIKAAIRRTPLIALDYDVDPTPRWGFGKPPHARLQALIAASSAQYTKLLMEIATYRFDFLAIPERSTSPLVPSRINDYFSGLDALALYALLRMRKPRRYLEIGSGNSTRFAARAISDEGCDTRIISIDPQPRAEIDTLAQRIVRASLESVDQEIFRELQPGDFLFFDGSHYCLPNSDVVTFFLEILPELPAGVVVQVHDIRLPYDYPPKLKRHWYGEQYILAMYLLSTPRPDVLLPNYFIWEQPKLRALVDDIGGGNSFWFVT
ncbi:class I SAM-dependent methyltransferase [Povalibacter sp.]|uniref:class I SAM-dependent methyltransferase n=1 Tax=Povalibacter sp. TaxID=1962978 RepID=UPI002F41CB60